MTRKVLIVDQDASVAADVATRIRHGGSTAHTAETFPDAVRLLDAVRPDLLVVGLRLGAYNGLHLLLRARAGHPPVCAIVVGPPDPIAERDARAFGAAAYLAAPVTATTIVDEIEKLTSAGIDDEDDDGGPASWQIVLQASVS